MADGNSERPDLGDAAAGPRGAVPRVTVAVPTYNCATYLPAALDSILGQSFADLEILVVDDGSTDDTDAALAPYRAEIRYERHANCGIGESRNRALALARGKYVAFLDADDIWEPDHLAISVAALDRHPSLGAVFGEFRIIDGAGDVVANAGTRVMFKVFDRNALDIADAFQERDAFVAHGRKVSLLTGGIFETLFLGNFVLPTSLVLRRELALACEPFTSLRTQEDYEYLLRFSRRHLMGFVTEPMVRYRRHPNQLTSFARMESVVTAASGIVDQYKDEFARMGRHDVFRRRKAGLCATLGSVYLRQGRVREARRTLAEGIRHDPRNLAGYAHFALSLLPYRVLASVMRW